MDIVAACRAFVAVSGHGSFTSGAAAARIPQSVASRRIAALEEHFGARLFDRTSRAVRLTPFGQDMLPTARRLVDLADAMADDAERAGLRPLRIAVPEICPPHRLAALVVAARRQRIHLEVRPAGPQERERLCQTLEVGAGIVAVPEALAPWRVPLGLAARTPFPAPTVFLETLRSGRARAQARRRILIQPEDDVAHLRDPLTRAGQSAGLAPAQVSIAPYRITGPEALSLPRTAELLSAAAGRPVTHRDVTVDEAVAGLEGFERDLSALTFERVRAGMFAEVTDLVEHVTGRPARTLRNFLSDIEPALRRGGR